MTLQEYYTNKRDQLSVLTDNAAYDIKLLICHALGMSESTFFMNMHLILTDEQLASLHALIERRLNGEPLQYILEKWSFMSYDFYVSPACLIPRQDTETLVEYTIKEILRHKYTSVLDMCTGSGCIAISLEKACGAQITASDISDAALEIAKKNALLNNSNIRFIKSDMFLNIKERFDVITANPPYLTKYEMDNLQKELTFEPYSALYGGVDGLDYYRRISASYRDFLTDDGIMILEIGETQGEAVKSLFENAEIITDICGKDRIIAVHNTK